MKKFVIKTPSILSGILLLLLFATFVKGQSANVNFPTPITSDSINGNIKARDIGDSRLTSHYYVFEGRQGDIFLKIEANNLDGDIDIYYADGMRPITKVKLYSDSSVTETGREIYLRKSEKLILRIEGRSPNDDQASYKIIFSGSFQSVAENNAISEPNAPKASSATDSDVKVNSVGTIIERKPLPTPQPKSDPITRNREVKSAPTKPVSTSKTTAKKEQPVKPKASTTVAKSTKTQSPKTTKPSSTSKTATTNQPSSNPKKTTAKTPTPKKETPKVEPKADSEAELATAMENVRLVVLLKNGRRFDRPMSDVLRFGIDKGILTIINKNGGITRYSILEITKITVE